MEGQYNSFELQNTGLHLFKTNKQTKQTKKQNKNPTMFLDPAQQTFKTYIPYNVYEIL